MNLQLQSQAQYPIQTTYSEPLTRQEKTDQILSDIIPNGLLLTSQALNPIALSETAATASTFNLAGMASTATIGANLATGVLGALQIALNWGKSSPAAGATSGIAVGASIGTLIAPGLGTAIGAGLGAIGGGLIGCIKTGKHKDQKVRDVVRERLVNAGILSSDYQLKLANGKTYDMGQDGGPRVELGGRRPYEIDFSNPLTQATVGWLDPIIAMIAPGNDKIRSDFTGYFTNAVLSQASTLEEVRTQINYLLTKFGLNDRKLAQGITELAQGGWIDGATAQGWINGIEQRRLSGIQAEDE